MSLKVIGTDMDRSITYNFLLTLHSNHEPIPCRFPEKRRFQTKIANFSNPRVSNAPAEGVPLKFGTDARGQKTRMMGLPDGRNSFTMGLAVETQYRRVTDGQTNRHATTPKTALNA